MALSGATLFEHLRLHNRHVAMHERFLNRRRPHPIFVARVDHAETFTRFANLMRRTDAGCRMTSFRGAAGARWNTNLTQRALDWSAFRASWGRF